MSVVVADLMDTTKAWAGLPLPIDDRVRALFEASVSFQIGNGASTQFWTDPWCHVGKFSSVFPALFKQCTLRKIKVQSAMENDKWMGHFKANLTAEALQQFIRLWNSLLGIQLNADIPDKLRWKWTTDGCYTASSAYAAQFIGTIRPSFPLFIWKSDAPPKQKFYAWLAVQGRCLTADNLAKRGIPHNPCCPLCNSCPETAAHLLAACSYTQVVWKLVVDRARLPITVVPAADTTSLSTWMEDTSRTIDENAGKLWRSVTPLVWWSIWKERNERVFRQHACSPVELFQKLLAEGQAWINAGRRRVLALVERPLEPD
ncbi:unnamed protein product [Alopecurus aequalis]